MERWSVITLICSGSFPDSGSGTFVNPAYDSRHISILRCRIAILLWKSRLQRHESAEPTRPGTRLEPVNPRPIQGGGSPQLIITTTVREESQVTRCDSDLGFLSHTLWCESHHKGATGRVRTASSSMPLPTWNKNRSYCTNSSSALCGGSGRTIIFFKIIRRRK